MEDIKEAVSRGNYRFSVHARGQMSFRNIDVEEVEQAIMTGEVIEDYPDDKYRPSCLILGYTEDGRPIHVQCCRPLPEVVVITCYEPDPAEWLNHRVRRESRR